MLIQPWIKVMHFSLLWLTLHIWAWINISHLSISCIVSHGRSYISHCFVFWVCFWTVYLVVLVFFKCMINLTSFLFKSRFISSLLFIHLFIFLFFFWLSNFSHVKRLRLVDYFVCLFCFLSWNCRVIIHNFITFLPFNIIVHFILKFALFFTTRFISNLF